MSIFYREEEPPNPCKKYCRCLSAALKDAFSKCHSFGRSLPVSGLVQDEEPAADFDEEEEVFVSAIISKYMESKSRRKSFAPTDSFHWVLSPTEWDSIMNPETAKKQCNNTTDIDQFFSAVSSLQQLSQCSSTTSFDDALFLSAKSCFSRYSPSSSNEMIAALDFQDYSRRRSAIIMELLHCEGWPFGLCRKALLLPPLPKCPSDSWSWRKSTGCRLVKDTWMSFANVPKCLSNSS